MATEKRLIDANAAVQRWMVMGMTKCKACGREFSSTNPNAEICYPCNNALKRLNGYAVPVVRCKDCRHWQESVDGITKWCPLLMDKNTKADDFCSYGERRNG